MPRWFFPSVFFCFCIFPLPAWSHLGGLDSYGCHHDRKHGGYHCHKGALSGQSFPSKDEMLRRLKGQKPSGDSKSGKAGIVEGHESQGGKLQLSDVDVLPPAVSQPTLHAYAIVIGIEQYRQGLPKADFAKHDATVMAEYVTKTMGYAEENVVLLVNERAARTDLEKYLEDWLPKRVQKDDAVFVYFSGHGSPNPTTGEAYLMPYDGDPAFVEKTGYPLKRLYERLAALPAKETVVVLDSCFSGAGKRSVMAKGTRPMGLAVENPVAALGRTVVLAASSGSQISSTYDTKGHGLLTYFLLKGLKGEADRNKDRSIEITELFEYVKPQVESVARREYNNEQTPQLLGNPDVLKKGVRLRKRAGS